MKNHSFVKNVIIPAILMCMALFMAGTAYAGTLESSTVQASKPVFGGKCGPDVSFSFTSNGVLNISGEGKMWDFPVVGEVNRKTHGKSIKKIVVDYGVTSIGKEAFANLSSVTSVSLPKSVRSIGYHAFTGCNALKSITIPSGVSDIHFQAFEFHEGLQNIYVDSANQYYSSSGGVLYSKDRKTLVCYPLKHSKADTFRIPEGVEVVNDWAFYGNQTLKRVVFPSSLRIIYSGAFEFCDKLKVVDFPDGMYYVGSRAFAYCHSLKSVHIPAGLSNGEGTKNSFNLCRGLESATIEEGSTRIRESAFSGCIALKTVYIPASVTSIENYAFMDCGSLEHIYFGGTKTQWGNIRFGNENLGHLGLATIHYNSGLNDLSSGSILLYKSSYIYTGKAILPDISVTLNGETLTEGKQYAVSYVSNMEVGTGTIIVKGIGEYSGRLERSFQITAPKSKKKNTLTLKVQSRTYKQSDLKKPKTFSIGVSKAQGKVTYSLSSTAKKAKITVTSAGTVTMPKNCKAGVYKITVTAAGTNLYQSAKKTVTIKVK